MTEDQIRDLIVNTIKENAAPDYSSDLSEGGEVYPLVYEILVMRLVEKGFIQVKDPKMPVLFNNLYVDPKTPSVLGQEVALIVNDFFL